MNQTNLRRVARTFLNSLLLLKYRFFGRPVCFLESSKAQQRRVREGFFKKYCHGFGLDVGYGGDLLTSDCRGWDMEHGDAQYLRGIPNESYDFVYSSHTLEHMNDPAVSLKNWWRVVKTGGYLIIFLPHRDLYEKKKTLPSRWNPDHKHFFLLNENDPPDTLGILPLITRSIDGYEVMVAQDCSEGHTITDPSLHSDGEYSIEVVLKKIVLPGRDSSTSV